MIYCRLFLFTVGFFTTVSQAQLSVRCLKGYSPTTFELVGGEGGKIELWLKVYQRTHILFGQSISGLGGSHMAAVPFDSAEDRENLFKDALTKRVTAGNVSDPVRGFPGTIDLDLSGPEKRLSFAGQWNYAGGATGNFNLEIHGTTGTYSVHRINLMRDENTQLSKCEWISGQAPPYPENDEIDMQLLKLANSRSIALAGQALLNLLNAYPDLDLVEIERRLLSLDAGFYLTATRSVPPGLCIGPTIKEKKVAKYRLQFNWGDRQYVEDQLRKDQFASEEQNLEALKQTGLLQASCQDL